MDKIGPGLWYQLHWAAYKSDQTKNVSFFNKLIKVYPDMIPCNECKIHMNLYLLEHKFPTEGNFLRWTVEFHNHVNKQLNKPIHSYESVLNKFIDNKHCDACKK